jgi:soluble lytic murein transglycosylase-like protein
MVSSTGSRVRDLGCIAMALLGAGCASGGDALPRIPHPEPLAIAGQEPGHQLSWPARPSMSSRSSMPLRISRSRHPVSGPDREPQHPAPPRAPKRERVDSAALERAVTRRFTYQPLSLALARRTRKPELADRVAAAVVYEAERNRMSPSLLAAVLLIENAPFDTTAISSQGAVGLMQVMPVHIGSYGCPSPDLNSVEANICHGARLLHTYIKRAGSLPLALKRYNGCVRGRNTPRCHRYPGRVLRTASKLRHEVLVNAAGFPGGLPDDVASGGSAPALPSQTAEEPDTSIVTTTTSASECTTFIGCLRHRWSQR